jgi:hypothetical protein
MSSMFPPSSWKRVMSPGPSPQQQPAFITAMVSENPMDIRNWFDDLRRGSKESRSVGTSDLRSMPSHLWSRKTEQNWDFIIKNWALSVRENHWLCFFRPSRVRLSTGYNYPETFTSNGQPDIDSLSDLLEDDRSPEEKKRTGWCLQRITMHLDLWMLANSSIRSQCDHMPIHPIHDHITRPI